MSLKIIHGNVLDAAADAVIMTIDGSGKGMQGNIAHQFARRYPEVWEEIAEAIEYPIPLGRVFDYEPSSECPFRLILLASTLHHKEILSESAKKNVIRASMEEAIHTAGQYEFQRVVTAVMKGGWRFSRTEDAFIAMSEGYDPALQKWPSIHLDIYAYDQGDYDKISSLARSIGWR